MAKLHEQPYFEDLKKSAYMVVAETQDRKTYFLRKDPFLDHTKISYGWCDSVAALFSCKTMAQDVAKTVDSEGLSGVRVVPVTFGESLFQEDIEITKLQQKVSTHELELLNLNRRITKLKKAKKEKEQNGQG